MKRTNVLVLSAGRRVELVQALQQELAVRAPGARVIAADSNPDYSSACRVADDFVPIVRATDPEYASALMQLCEARGVGLVVPTIDTELLPLAKLRDAFETEGTSVIVSDEALVQACRDKRKTNAVFESIGIPVPTIYPRDAIEFPCFSKPYDGSSGIGAAVLRQPADLTPAMLGDPKLIFMQLIGADHAEYTVDAFYDRQGELKCLVPRLRIETRAGEVSKAVTRKGPLYDYLRDRLGRLGGARGVLTVQVFSDEQAASVYGIEINPRFGGGFPLSQAVGANYTGWLIDEYLSGRQLQFFDDWEADAMMLRYDAKVIVRGVA